MAEEKYQFNHALFEDLAAIGLMFLDLGDGLTINLGAIVRIENTSSLIITMLDGGCVGLSTEQAQTLENKIRQILSMVANASKQSGRVVTPYTKRPM